MADTSYLGYNLNPAPQAGKGAYGSVPGAIGIPPSVYQEIEALYPGIAGLTAGSGDVIKSQQAGQISPQTMSNIANVAASRGVALGQPNSDIANMIGMGITGSTSEGLQQAGVSNYQNFLAGLGSTQISPQLTAEIASQNALYAAAPDPAQAAAAQIALLNKYANPASGTMGGGGMRYNPAGNIGLGYGNGYSGFGGIGSFGGMGTGTYSAPGQGGFGGGGSPYSVYDIGGYGGSNVDMSGFY